LVVASIKVVSLHVQGDSQCLVGWLKGSYQLKVKFNDIWWLGFIDKEPLACSQWLWYMVEYYSCKIFKNIASVSIDSDWGHGLKNALMYLI